jgi:hypothetical protein
VTNKGYQEIVIPIPNVKGNFYKLIVDFEEDVLYRKCTLHKFGPAPTTSKSLEKFS